jgi:glycine betaine/proline transport system permease protein
MDDILNLFPLPLDHWIQNFVDWFVGSFRPLFQAIRWPIASTLDGIRDLLLGIPIWLGLVLVLFAGWRAAGWRVGLFSFASMASIAAIGFWSAAMTTLAIIMTAVAFAILVGVPMGIGMARSDRFQSILRPVLDFMQSTPSFVYLVPVVMLFGVGTVPGVIATTMFATPPIIRLTNVGLRQVPPEVIEAGHAFGSTELQLLRDIRLPLALPVIMAGLNQTVMAAMIMSVIASMIGADGLGSTVLRGIGRLDVGLAATGGLGITLMAMTIDRITQGFGQSARPKQPIRLAGAVERFLRIAQLRIGPSGKAIP